MFIYTIKTMNLFNLTFIPNVNYMIRSEKNITFSFKGVEYTLFGNKLVEEIEISKIYRKHYRYMEFNTKLQRNYYNNRI